MISTLFFCGVSWFDVKKDDRKKQRNMKYNKK